MRVRTLLLTIFAFMLFTGQVDARRICPILCGGSNLAWVLPGAAVDEDFSNGRYFGCTPSSCLAITRASSKTNLLPSSAAGFAYSTFGNNILAITPGLGLLIEESRTNQLLNSVTPVTQTTGSLGTGAYTLWVNGAGSATMSSGTATGCGTGVSTNGSVVNFTISVAGTCIVTVAGALNAFQLELGGQGSSLIVTSGTTATRSADVITQAGVAATVMNGTSKSIVVASSGLMAAALKLLVDGGGSASPSYVYLNGTNLTSYSGAAAFIDGTFTPANNNKLGFSQSPASESLVGNGGTVATSNLSYAANSTLNLGSGGSSNFINGYIRRLTLWTTKLPDVTLQAFTL